MTFDLKQYLMENRVSLDEGLTPAAHILDICKKIRNSRGYQEDDTSEWLGPWLHHIEDEAKKINKQPGY